MMITWFLTKKIYIRIHNKTNKTTIQFCLLWFYTHTIPYINTLG